MPALRRFLPLLNPEHLICLGILLTLECQKENGHERHFVMVIGILIPIVLLYFFTPSKTRPSDLDLGRKRRGPQPPNPPPDAWSGDQRLSFFSNRRALALPEPGAGISSFPPPRQARRAAAHAA
ncbi:hypothetical protein [Rhizobium leguminosarum]|uniref:hypothetical protein n=1 Tax=Rhizobium leguminosarum TaxID=384 RepID=UPI001C988B6D|nr:hypothetical protein [Rhizobium leguminosarum]